MTAILQISFCILVTLVILTCWKVSTRKSLEKMAIEKPRRVPFNEVTSFVGSTDFHALVSVTKYYHRLIKLGTHTDNLEGFLSSQLNQIKMYLLAGHSDFVDQVCETGFNGGHSSLALLFGNLHSAMTSFDFFNKSFQPLALALLEGIFGDDRIKVIPGDTKISLTNFTDHSTTFRCNLISVDGGHDFGSAMSDLTSFQKIAACDHILLMDDIFQKNADAWNAHHVDGAKLAWLESINRNSVRQFGCWEFYEDQEEIWRDSGVWGAAKRLPRAFCIGMFQLPHCPSNRGSSRILEIIKAIGLKPCASGCCN